MSAAQWRRAMNGGLAAARPRPASPRAVTVAPVVEDPYADSDAPRWLKYLWRTLSARHVFITAFVLVFPFVATPFFTFQVASQSLVLGLIALSLAFLAGYGGMVSLAQMTVAGIAGYGIAVLGFSSSAEISLRWPWWVAVPAAIALAMLCATLIGWLSVRTEGIYTIMITLAIGVAFYYLVLQNYSVFNGFQGLREVKPPTVFGIDWREPVPFYFLVAVLCAGRLLPGALRRARAVRHRAAGRARQPAAHGGARLQRRRAPRRRLCAGRAARRGRRRAARLVQRADDAGLGGHRLDDQHPGHRRARRREAPDRRLPRRASSSCCCRPSPST